jgi:hypothetical protein
MPRLAMLSLTRQDSRLELLAKLWQPGMCQAMPWPFLLMLAKLSPQARIVCARNKMDITFAEQRHKVAAA